MSNWTSYQLNQIGDIITGYTPSTFNSNLWSGNIPFYSPSDFVDQVYCSSTERKISKDAIVKNRLIYPNSIMVTCIGSIGKIAMAQYKGVTNQQINTLICYEDFDPYFIFYSIKKNISKLHALYGITTIPIVNKNMFGTINLEIPDLPTQKRIAKILSTVDGQIEKTDAIIAKYQVIKQGMLHDLFTRGIDLATGKLRPTPEQAPELYKPSPLGLIPKAWNTGKMSKYLEFIEQGWSPNCDDIPAIENEWGILKTTAVTWGGYDQKQNKVLSNSLMPKHQYEVKINDILITRAGPNSRVGVVAYVNKTRNKLIFSDKIYRAIPIKSKITNHFLYLILSSNYSQMELSGYKTGMAESQTNISQAIILKLIVIHPNIDEQELISSKIKKNDMLISSEKDYLTKLQKLKQGVMSKLLQGNK